MITASRRSSVNEVLQALDEALAANGLQPVNKDRDALLTIAEILTYLLNNQAAVRAADGGTR